MSVIHRVVTSASAAVAAVAVAVAVAPGRRGVYFVDDATNFLRLLH